MGALRATPQRAGYLRPRAGDSRRVQRLLGPFAPGSPGRLREFRAVEVLEGIGTEDARQVLEAIGKGDAESLLTLEAKGTRRRMMK